MGERKETCMQCLALPTPWEMYTRLLLKEETSIFNAFLAGLEDSGPLHVAQTCPPLREGAAWLSDEPAMWVQLTLRGPRVSGPHPEARILKLKALASSGVYLWRCINLRYTPKEAPGELRKKRPNPGGV